MKRIFALLLMMTMVLTLPACGAGNDKVENGADNKLVIGAESDEPIYTISAGGLELKYPQKWQDKVTVEVENDRACFTCGETKLFDIVFNGDEGAVLGTVKGEANTVIRVVDYTLESEDEELAAMQEDVNIILNHLAKDYDFEVGTALESEDNTTFDIETNLVTMKYPAKWQDKVQVETTEDGVKFCANDTPLFDLIFTDCDGYLLGSYKDTPIYIVEYPVETDEQAAMQEDVNVILQHLQEDSNFVMAT